MQQTTCNLFCISKIKQDFVCKNNTVERSNFSTADDFKWLVANQQQTVTDTRYTVKGLSGDDVYEFRVAAENKAGVGPASDPAQTRAKTPVGKNTSDWMMLHTFRYIYLSRELTYGYQSCVNGSCTISDGREPAILDGLRDVTVTSPAAAILECRLNAGDPRANITWMKDNKKLTSNKQYEMTFENDLAVLKVKDTDYSDAGDYRIEAKNKLGKAQSDCSVTVYCECSGWQIFGTMGRYNCMLNINL